MELSDEMAKGLTGTGGAFNVNSGMGMVGFDSGGLMKDFDMGVHALGGGDGGAHVTLWALSWMGRRPVEIHILSVAFCLRGLSFASGSFRTLCFVSTGRHPSEFIVSKGEGESEGQVQG